MTILIEHSLKNMTPLLVPSLVLCCSYADFESNATADTTTDINGYYYGYYYGYNSATDITIVNITTDMTTTDVEVNCTVWSERSSHQDYLDHWTGSSQDYLDHWTGSSQDYLDHRTGSS